MRIEAAKAEVTTGAYPEALTLLAMVAGECTAIKEYGVALEAANTALAGLTDPTVAADKARIQRDRIDAAKTLAAARDYGAAKALLERVSGDTGECKAANDVVAAQVEANRARGQAQTDIDGIDADADQAIAAVQRLLDTLRSHAEASAIETDLDAIQGDIDTARAEAGDSPGDAKARLNGAADACVAARLAADRLAQVNTAHGAAKRHWDTLTEPVIASDRDTIKNDHLDKALTEAAARRFDAALTLLIPVESLCKAAKALAALAAKYLADLPVAEAKLAELTEPVVAADKGRIEATLIDLAELRVTTSRDYTAALTLLAKVEPECDAANAIAVAHAAYAPKLTESETKFTAFRDRVVEAEVWQPFPDLQAKVTDIEVNYIDEAKTEAGNQKYPTAMELLAQAATKSEQGKYLADNYFYVFNFMAGTEGEVNSLRSHAGAISIAAEIAECDAKLANAKKLRDDDAQWTTAREILDGVFLYQCPAAKRIAQAFTDTTAKLTAAQRRYDTAKLKVDGLTSPIAAISAALATVQADYLDAAQKLIDIRGFKAAAGLLAQVDGLCTAVEALVTQHGQYETALRAAELAVDGLTDPAIATDAAAIRAERIDPAKVAVAIPDYAGALALLAKVAGECAAAKALVTGRDEAGREQGKVQLLVDAMDGDAEPAFEAVKKLLGALTSHAGAAGIVTQMDAISKLVYQARTADTPTPVAQEKLTAAATACVKARVLADRHVAYVAALEAAKLLVEALTQPVIAADKARITTQYIDAAATAAGTQDYLGAARLLHGVAAACNEATAIAAAHADYSAKLTAAEDLVSGLNALTPPDPVIGADVQKIKTDRIDAAKAKATPDRDYDAARALLAKVEGECDTAKLKKKMHGGAAPTEAEISALIGKPNGTALLDAMIQTLPDSTARSVVKKAIELRFGKTLELFRKDASALEATDLDAGHAKSLKKIYELMTMVPEAHIMDNPVFTEIKRYGGAEYEAENRERGSSYNQGVVVLSCGRAKDIANLQPLANVTLALPDVKPGCELVPDGVDSPPPTYFDWTTMHEVGHAIDDKKRFMQGKAGDASFGGWKDHGYDIKPIAAAAAAHFHYDEGYIVGYLLKSNPAPPAPPDLATDPDDWDDRRQKAEEWCDAVRLDKELWEYGSETKKRAIGGRVYHEAYANDWVSYDLSARTKGITGYQFRAPGEWLAELYGAYHTQKLPDTHPAVAWLETL